MWRCVPHELEAEKRMKCGAQQVVSNKRQMLYDALDCLFASLRVCLLVCLVGSCWFLFVYVLTVFSFPASTCNLKFQSALDCGLDAAKLWVQVLSAVRAHQGHRDWASNDSQVTGCSLKPVGKTISLIIQLIQFPGFSWGFCVCPAVERDPKNDPVILKVTELSGMLWDNEKS